MIVQASEHRAKQNRKHQAKVRLHVKRLESERTCLYLAVSPDRMALSGPAREVVQVMNKRGGACLECELTGNAYRLAGPRLIEQGYLRRRVCSDRASALACVAEMQNR